MIPPDIDEYNRLLDTALKGMAFEEDTFGFKAAKEEAFEERLREELMVAAQAAMPELEDIFEMDSDGDSLEEPEPMDSRLMMKSMRRSVRDKKKTQ